MAALLLIVGLLGLLILLALAALSRAGRLAHDLRRLEDRLTRLEGAAGVLPAPTEVTPPADETASSRTVTASLAGSAPAVAASGGAAPSAVVTPSFVVAPSALATPPPSLSERVAPPPPAIAPPPPAIAPPPPAIAPPPTIAAPAPSSPRKARDMEQMVGGVWLQNAGSVLVLVGVFFLILWGWTTGRFGAGVLVSAGVVLGLGIAWRGDRMRRVLPGIGHALIGVGLGVVYLALYLGHFTLQVLSAPVAFAALVAASAAAVLAGLRYRVQTIAALGVVGAFLPQALAGFLPLRGFSLLPAALLAYLASVDALVLVLAARVGWSALAFAAVLLSSGTWILDVHAREWSWPLEIGLAAMFAALGLAPLPQLAKAEGRVRPSDLALVAVTPLAFIACSWPMWEVARSVHVALLLMSLAALYVAASLWVDARRPERDLWRPLTGAATVFLTAALQRAVGTDNTPLAWTVEGAVLVVLGLAPRAGWIRLCGYVVATIGGLWLLGELLPVWDVSGHPIPVWNADGLRDAVAIAAILVAGARLRAARARLAPGEMAMPSIWVGVANLMILLWTSREIGNLAWSLEGTGGRWRRVPDVEAASGTIRQSQLSAAGTALAWLVQSAALVRASLRAPESRWPFLRVCGYVVVFLALIMCDYGLSLLDGWARDLLPVLHREGLLFLACAITLVALAAGLAASRADLGRDERYMPEIVGGGAALVLLMWSAREADHVARVALAVPGAYSSAWQEVAAASRTRLAALVPTLVSVGWLAQALVTLALGWWRRSAFMRWMGLGLVGLTALKILIVDLAHADPFWRFLGAIATGAAMLVVSYAYQRRKKKEEGAGPAT